MSNVRNNKFLILLKSVASVQMDIIETNLVFAFNVKVTKNGIQFLKFVSVSTLHLKENV